MSIVFFLCVLGTELNGEGHGKARVSLRSVQVENILVMALDLNLIRKVIGFSSVTLMVIFVGSCNKSIREVGVLSPFAVESPVHVYYLSRFSGCDNLGNQFILFVNQECLFSYWARVCNLRYGHVQDVKFT